MYKQVVCVLVLSMFVGTSSQAPVSSKLYTFLRHTAHVPTAQVADAYNVSGLTVTECSVRCADVESCQGFTMTWATTSLPRPRTGDCLINTELYGTSDYRTDDARDYCVAPGEVLPRQFIVGCTSSPARPNRECDNAYDGSTLGEEYHELGFVKIGTGLYAATGWIRVVLVQYFWVRGVRLINRCVNPKDQADEIRITTGDMQSTTEGLFPCHTDCSLAEDFVDFPLSVPTHTDYVRVDLLRRCLPDFRGVVGLREMQVVL